MDWTQVIIVGVVLYIIFREEAIISRSIATMITGFFGVLLLGIVDTMLGDAITKEGQAVVYGCSAVAFGMFAILGDLIWRIGNAASTIVASQKNKDSD